MTNKQITQTQYTQTAANYQLYLPMDVEEMIPMDDSVRLHCLLCERMDYRELLQAYSPKGRKPAVDPVILFKVITYAASQKIYSSREIEKACRRDINFRWLLQGYAAPDHATISRFKQKYLTDTVMEQLFFQQVVWLYEQKAITGETLYIDGTKIEAYANRYSFVWKKAITKHEAKMYAKWQALLEQINTTYCQLFTSPYETFLKDLKKVLVFLEKIQEEENITFVYGKGKRKNVLQRYHEQVKEMLQRKEHYDASNEIMGEKRNSYSKTDHDATFMRMKDDHMRNGQLKPAYNVQAAVDAEFIVGIDVFSDRNDTTTLIPLLQYLKEHLPFTYRHIVADSGYESEENYVYLKKQKQTAYIKPQNHERKKKASFKKDIKYRENMAYDKGKDTYTCANDQQLHAIRNYTRTSQTGYQSQVTVYESEDCTGCPLKEKCTKAKGNRQLHVAKEFLAYRETAQENILTETGTLYRMNRSIQVEGTFGVLKEDYHLKKFHTRGTGNVRNELLILAFGYNLNKIHTKIQADRLNLYYHPLKPA
ncbi:IS1182 family transposase [Oceanobacillus jeddahense]|uniref:IS1182 family transposase n=1 Tax=Oceanobacillus jeddahense TaxID=1462527 RepID=A0ABY5JND0_9BACI|nr:IS1182 family transposase [Oceanobacillus jeddahense]UUI01458.1 IS1182 family transposase [Oceanobacillus jeddahense]UUI01815.1 IS1182 family transposase [Oceanobacillus jeddahense]